MINTSMEIVMIFPICTQLAKARTERIYISINRNSNCFQAEITAHFEYPQVCGKMMSHREHVSSFGAWLVETYFLAFKKNLFILLSRVDYDRLELPHLLHFFHWTSSTEPSLYIICFGHAVILDLANIIFLSTSFWR